MAVPFKILENIGSAILNEKNLSRVIEIDMDRIYPNPNQPRRRFTDSDMAELAASIKINGLIQPIVVRRIEMGYELVAGERRFRAARLCGMTEIPCIIVDTTERGSAMISLVENMQRKDLNFFEEAEAINSLTELFGLTQEDIALRLGKKQSTIANKMRLLKLSKEERKLILEYGLTERHARALLKIDDNLIRMELIKIIFERKLNVENTEKLIESTLKRNNEIRRIRKCKGAFRDVRIFVNTITHAVEIMQAAGINAVMQKSKEKEYTEYIVRIPN